MDAFPLAAFVRVRIEMRRADEGGRKSPIRSGYRPNCWIGRLTEDAEREYSDAAVWLETGDSLAPGDAALARLQPARPSSWALIEVGSLIEVCEGHRVVADTEVNELFPDSATSDRSTTGGCGSG